MEILKKEYRKNDFSILLQDDSIKIWLDCCLMDGYGNKSNYKTDDLYIDWEFNQYIFMTDNENDLKIKEYQENVDNIEKITEFIDEHNGELIKDFLKNGGRK